MEPTVSAATVHAIVAYARQRSIAIHIESRESRYPFAEVAELWSRIEKSDALAGTRAAALVPFGAFGVVEHLMLLSGTVEQSLARLVRYYPTVNEAFLLTTRSVRGGTLLELHACDGARIPRAYADFVLTSIRRRIEIAGITRTPAGLLIDSASMKAALPFADEELCEVLQDVVRRRVDRRTAAACVSNVLRTRLDRPSLADVAAHMGISIRTLQRRLIQEGTSFREVLDGTRRALASRLLDDRMPVKQIADRLGFAEVRSFYRWRVRSLH
jgi:AraC-like DNA-binding protein